MAQKIPVNFRLFGVVAGLLVLAAAIAITRPSRRHSTELFDEVWETVNRNYYDREFNGYDWKSIHDSFRAKLPDDGTENGTVEVIHQMLSLLESSHLAFVPAWQVKAGQAGSAMGLLFPDSFAMAGLTVTDWGHAKTPLVLSVDPGSPLYGGGVRTGQHIAIGFQGQHEQQDGKIIFAMTRSDGSAFEVQSDLPKAEVAAPPPVLSPDGQQIIVSRLDPASLASLNDLARSLRTRDVVVSYRPLALVTTLPSRSAPLRVIDVVKGSPADRAGIDIGSQLLEFRQTHTKNGVPGHFSATFRSPDGSVRRLEADDTTYISGWQPYLRAARTIGHTRVVRFDQFSDESVAWALQQIRVDQTADSLILDFRNNSGGSLSSTLQFLAALIPGNTPIGEETNADARITLRVPEGGIPVTTRLAVLVGPASASAAEVVAATLQTQKRGIVLGGTTSGDVLIARMFKLRDGAELQIPCSNFHDDQGRELEGFGVTPDVAVWNDLASIRAGRDIPLQRALEILAVEK